MRSPRTCATNCHELCGGVRRNLEMLAPANRNMLEVEFTVSRSLHPLHVTYLSPQAWHEEEEEEEFFMRTSAAKR